jgi:hypothetical protein
MNEPLLDIELKKKLDAMTGYEKNSWANRNPEKAAAMAKAARAKQADTPNEAREREQHAQLRNLKASGHTLTPTQRISLERFNERFGSVDTDIAPAQDVVLFRRLNDLLAEQGKMTKGTADYEIMEARLGTVRREIAALSEEKP